MPDRDEVLEMIGTVISDMEWVPPQPTPELYANHVNMGMTLWDLTVHFGSIAGVDREHNRIQVVKRVSIHLSPETARALEMALSQALDQYEKTFGKLRFPNPEVATLKPGSQEP